MLYDDQEFSGGFSSGPGSNQPKNVTGTPVWARSTRPPAASGTGLNPATTTGTTAQPQPSSLNPAVTNSTMPGVGTYSAQSNLINAQINPQASQRLTNAQGMTDQSAQAFANWKPGMQSPGYQAVQGPDYSKVYATLSQYMNGANAARMDAGGGPSGAASDLQAKTLADLEKVRSGVDRGAIAASTYDTLAERGRPEFEGRVRQLGQNTAALGRVGSGMYGSNLVDINAERDRELSLSRQELANSAAGQTLADRLAILDATRGVSGDIAGQDAARSAGAYGAADRQFGQGLQLADFMAGLEDKGYGARTRERDTEYGVGRDRYGDDMAGFDRERSRFTTLGDYTSGMQGEERANRNELRDERDFQYGVNRDAVGDERWRYGAERDNWRDGLEAAGQYGFSGDPSRAQQYAANSAGQSASEGFAGLGDALGEYMYNRRTRNPAITTRPIQLPSQPVIPQFDVPPVSF